MSAAFDSRDDEDIKLPLSRDKDFHIWVLLHQTADLVFKASERELSKHGISAMEAAVLFIVHNIGGKTTPAEIARWLIREHHTVSALLNRMEKKGLIKKTKDVRRKNIWRIDLTEKGQKAYRQSAKRESIHDAVSSLSKDERQHLTSYLRKVRAQTLKSLVNKPTIPFP